MVNSPGGIPSTWNIRWQKAMKLQGMQYDLPQGAVGRQFTSLLAEEVKAVAEGTQVSERIFCLCATVLQREKNVKAGADIRRVLCNRMDMWRHEKYDELLQEAGRCDRQLGRGRGRGRDNTARVFTRLVSRGKLRDATRLVTDRSGGAVLHPDSRVEGDTTVLEVLRRKHPPQFLPSPDTFLPENELPLLVDVNLTAGHIEKAAHRLKGSAGPSGMDAEQWRNLLLRYGPHSTRLREAAAALTRRLSNRIVEWDSIRALLAS